MDRRTFLTALPAGLLIGSQRAGATAYFSADAVKRALFPNATRFVDHSTNLTKEQITAIGRTSRTRGFPARVNAFEAQGPGGKLGTLFIDRVYGKHEFITYAAALDASGAVKGIEIMDYRESYGDQVRNANWRAQFTGKRNGQPLQIDRPIRNISGATLSCVHITDGVRRLLATYTLLGL
jgi:hypothetical protein